MESVETLGVHVVPIRAVKRTGFLKDRVPRIFTSCSSPSETSMKVGIEPRRSSSVCIFTAPLVD